MLAHNSAATGSGVRVPESGSRGVSEPQVGQPRLPHGDGSPWRAWLSPSQVPGNTASPPQGPLFQEAKRVEQTHSARGTRTAALHLRVAEHFAVHRDNRHLSALQSIQTIAK